MKYEKFLFCATGEKQYITGEWNTKKKGKVRIRNNAVQREFMKTKIKKNEKRKN